MKYKSILTLFLIASNCYAFEFNNQLVGKIELGWIENEQNQVKKYDEINLEEERNIYLKSEDIIVENVKKIQLVYMGKKFTINYNKPVIILCEDLYSAHSMFHFTEVLCIVDHIEYIKN